MDEPYIVAAERDADQNVRFYRYRADDETVWAWSEGVSSQVRAAGLRVAQRSYLSDKQDATEERP